MHHHTLSSSCKNLSCKLKLKNSFINSGLRAMGDCSTESINQLILLTQQPPYLYNFPLVFKPTPAVYDMLEIFNTTFRTIVVLITSITKSKYTITLLHGCSTSWWIKALHTDTPKDQALSYITTTSKGCTGDCNMSIPQTQQSYDHLKETLQLIFNE